MRVHAAYLLLGLLPACAEGYDNTPLPLAPAYYPPTVSYHTTVNPPAVAAPAPPAPPAPPDTSIAHVPSSSGRTDPARVLILQTTHLDRPAEVVGVVDAHEEMGKHDEALRELREKAAALGADAVVGVEFHHGEGQGEPTHLSGLAVRFLTNVP